MKSYSIDTGNIYEQLIINNINVSYKEFYRGNPYNTKFTIKDFIRFVKEIKELYEFKLNQVELKDICYGSSVQFLLDKTGNISISGTLYRKLMEHSLTFIFDTYQTAIREFCRSLYKDSITQKTYLL